MSERVLPPVLDYLKAALREPENDIYVNPYGFTRKLLIHLNNDDLKKSINMIINEMNGLKKNIYTKNTSFLNNQLLIKCMDAIVATATYITFKMKVIGNKTQDNAEALVELQNLVKRKWAHFR